MSVNSKMKAVADKIRSLLGIDGTMGLDAMASNLGTVQTNIASAFTAVANKGGTVPSFKVVGNLAGAINSIPSGVAVQRAAGSFTTNGNGFATVNVGFQPDIILITGMILDGYNFEFHSAVVFSESTRSDMIQSSASYSNEFPFGVFFNWARETTGFITDVTAFDSSWGQSKVANTTFNCVVMKYT